MVVRGNSSHLLFTICQYFTQICLSLSTYRSINLYIYLSVPLPIVLQSVCHILYTLVREVPSFLFYWQKKKKRERDLEKRSNVLRAYCRHLVVLGVWALHSNPSTGKAWAPATGLHCLPVLYPVVWTSSPPLLLGESKPSFQPFPLCHALGMADFPLATSRRLRTGRRLEDQRGEATFLACPSHQVANYGHQCSRSLSLSLCGSH